MFSEAQFVPLSALQHFLYCPRQCALIHVERLWAEDRNTAEGRRLHEKAHEGGDEKRGGVRIVRGLAVRSDVHGLTGICDVVEFGKADSVTPIEYKRGRPKAHRADEIQICGQAICLEETLGRESNTIGRGFLFYGRQQRRTEVIFEQDLRCLTLEVAAAVRAMIHFNRTPTAEYAPALCDRCSLISLCQPKAMRFKRGAASWFTSQLESSLQ